MNKGIATIWLIIAGAILIAASVYLYYGDDIKSKLDGNEHGTIQIPDISCKSLKPFDEFSLRITAKNVRDALEAAKTEAKAQGGTIRSENLYVPSKIEDVIRSQAEGSIAPPAKENASLIINFPQKNDAEGFIGKLRTNGFTFSLEDATSHNVESECRTALAELKLLQAEEKMLLALSRESKNSEETLVFSGGLETVLNDAEIWLDDLKEMRDRKHEASVLVYISSL